MKKPIMQTTNPVARTPAPSAPSIIGQDIHIEGNINGDGELQLEGAVTGNVSCNALVMGNSGSVTGDIRAETVTVRGRVDGQISAKTVHLDASALINGDVFYDSLTVESGAKLNGRFSHGSAQKIQTSANNSPVNTSTAPKEAAE